MNQVCVSESTPKILGAVRAVGIIKPKFDPQQQNFIPPQLDIMGTAFLIKEYNVIVTCAHVVQGFLNVPTDVAGILVIGKEANYQPVSVDVIDFVHDLAILRFKKHNQQLQKLFDSFLNETFKDGLSLALDDPKVSESVMYAGYPLGNILLNSKHDPSYSEGVISLCGRKDQFGKKEFQISGNIVGGFSGSPVALKNDNGGEKIIGIISNSPNREAGQAGIFMAVSYQHIKALAELSIS